MDKLRYKLTSPVLMWAIVAFGGLLIYRALNSQLIFHPGLWGRLALVLGALDWLYVSWVSLRTHRRAAQSAQQIDRLISEGAYAVVRHPLYAADMVLAWCVFLSLPTQQVLGAVVWLTAVLLFWAKLEERMLEEKFLDDYRAYRRRVPMFIPRFGKK